MNADRLLASVIVCTRNRADSLSRMLDSLAVAAGKVSDPWEVLIVNNGSTDRTPEVVEHFKQQLPIRMVAQPVPGLSNARNAGVAAAKGDYALWTDDDVLVDVDWLAAWFDAFRTRKNDVVFGGRSEPLLEEPHQGWFKAASGELSSLLAFRDEPTWLEVTDTRVPYGLNYAVRMREQIDHLYDPALGVAPGRRRGGEEVAVLRSLLATGVRGSWVWGATVYHCIPLERQSVAYVRQFYRSNGYDWPVGGVGSGVVRRGRAILKAVLELSNAWVALRMRRLTSRSVDVTSNIRLARAQGSLARYLNRPSA